MRIRAVYPGTFDPFTNGHLDIVQRALRLFPKLVVAVAANPQKAPLFSLAERIRIIHEATTGMPGVEIDSFDALTVEYVRTKGARVIIRGIRAVSDFEFEFQMALMNQRLNSKIETIFMMPAEQYTYISSRLIKEVFALGGQVHGLVPDMVERRLREKLTPQPIGAGKPNR